MSRRVVRESKSNETGNCRGEVSDLHDLYRHFANLIHRPSTKRREKYKTVEEA